MRLSSWSSPSWIGWNSLGSIISQGAAHVGTASYRTHDRPGPYATAGTMAYPRLLRASAVPTRGRGFYECLKAVTPPRLSEQASVLAW